MRRWTARPPCVTAVTVHLAVLLSLALLTTPGFGSISCLLFNLIVYHEYFRSLPPTERVCWAGLKGRGLSARPHCALCFLNFATRNCNIKPPPVKFSLLQETSAKSGRGLEGRQPGATRRQGMPASQQYPHPAPFALLSYRHLRGFRRPIFPKNQGTVSHSAYIIIALIVVKKPLYKRWGSPPLPPFPVCLDPRDDMTDLSLVVRDTDRLYSNHKGFSGFDKLPGC